MMNNTPLNRSGSTAPSAPRLIEADELPVYPVDREERLEGHYFTKFWHDRWLNSQLHLTATLEVQACALNLFFLSQKQTPVGTLPDDDAILAKLLRIDLALWRDLRTRRITPLHGWHPCRCGDEIRLNHPVVTEVVLDAIARREARETSNSQKAVYQRLRRLREALGGLGCGKEVLANDLLIERLDEWLLHHCHGRRTHSAYARALQHAAADGWFTKGGNRRI